MSKVIFLGTDLHGTATELAAKTVNNIKIHLKDYKIVSIEHRKPFFRQDKTLIVPKIVSNSRIRRFSQALLLPFYLTFLRLNGYEKISSFWVANTFYHKLLFRYLKFLQYKIIFTVISQDVNFNVLHECDKIICQSESMKKIISTKMPNSDVELIYPFVNLNVFKPSKNKEGIIIPSVPYSVKDFPERGINLMLNFLNKNKIPSKIIFRSQESYNYVKSKDIKNTELINKDLSDNVLGKIMGNAKIMPLIYSKSPDMPYSAIEGLAAGCAIICTDKMSLSEIIDKEKAGISIVDKSQFKKAAQKILKTNNYNKNARKVAEKYFSGKNLTNYLRLYKN